MSGKVINAHARFTADTKQREHNQYVNKLNIYQKALKDFAKLSTQFDLTLISFFMEEDTVRFEIEKPKYGHPIYQHVFYRNEICMVEMYEANGIWVYIDWKEK